MSRPGIEPVSSRSEQEDIPPTELPRPVNKKWTLQNIHMDYSPLMFTFYIGILTIAQSASPLGQTRTLHSNVT